MFLFHIHISLSLNQQTYPWVRIKNYFKKPPVMCWAGGHRAGGGVAAGRVCREDGWDLSQALRSSLSSMEEE